jgi:hypothetical protein
LEKSRGLGILAGSTLLLAALQSVCTAVMTISGIRLAVGLSAFAVAGSVYAPIRSFHRDAIRIPMLTLAAAGAIVDLFVLAWMARLRSLPSAQWRRRESTSRERRFVRLQVALAILTLVLVGLETWTHSIMHPRSEPAHAIHASVS